MTLLKVLASLVGLILTLAGLGAFFVGLYLGAQYFFLDSSGPRLVGAPTTSRPDIVAVIACVVGGVVAVGLGTQLGRFAQGGSD